MVIYFMDVHLIPLFQKYISKRKDLYGFIFANVWITAKIYLLNKVLTVYEVHIYELLKFALRSSNLLHSETFLNDLFVFEKQKILEVILSAF